VDMESPRAGHGARAGKSIAADTSSPTRFRPKLQANPASRIPYAVVIVRGLWRGFDVGIEPPTSSHSWRHCRSHADALAVAEDIQRVEGWPVQDRTGGDR
jgi:hypothetical protein